MGLRIENNELIISNPETLNEVGRVRVSNIEDVESALSVAKNYKDWASLSLKKRCSIINKFRKIVVKNGDLVKQALKNETGKKDFDVFIEFFTHAIKSFF